MRNPIDISLPGHRRDTRDVRYHRPRLDPVDVTTHQGLRVSTVHRTLLDLGQTHPDRLNKAMANADFHGLLDFKLLDDVMGRATRHPGIAALKEAMIYHHPGFARTKSRLEDTGLLLVLKAGLPSPKVNVPVCGFEVDLWWPQQRLVVEWDGPRHSLPAAQAFDRMRDGVITGHAIRVLRFRDNVVGQHPRGVVREIARSLGRSGLVA